MYLIYGRKKIFIPFFLIIVIILAVGFVILKIITPQSAKDFTELKKIVDASGYELIDTSEANGDFILHSGTIYIDEDIKIEYTETDSSEHARTLRENIEEQIRKRTAGGKNYTLSVGRYYKYSKKSEDDSYELVIQINNTCVFAKVPYEYKDTVLSFLKKINYV